MLTDEEAKRFQRAVYRLWFLVIFQDHDLNGGTEAKVVKYLEKLSAAEVLELDCVHDFFGEICQWVHMASYQTPCMLLLSPFYSCINLAF